MTDDLIDAAEHFALTLTQYGLQRMTARVMAALLFTQQDTMTAGEIGAQLGVSSGAMSGALKNLTELGMIERVPAPGSRREHFRFRDGAWATLMSKQNMALTLMTEAADTGIEVAGQDTLAGRRLADMRDFYAYMLSEMPALIDRWSARRTGESGSPAREVRGSQM
ncbi:MarR family transcriptional regulator [Actinoplanes sp. NPDC049802]|uniref:GbsR/MarR family transcriptional regulator n=1 Tax=Actinoplanes sp. NPDC049802 TaxID=3154742 RepID=UPI0033F3BE60